MKTVLDVASSICPALDEGVTLSETNAALGGLGILEDLRGRTTKSCAHWTFHSTGRVLGQGHEN